MSARIRIILATVVILAPVAVHAAGNDEARARQELDQELKALVKIPAPRLALTIEPKGPEGMILDSVTAKVDGKVVHLGGAAAGPGITSVQLWAGPVAPGPHQVSLEVTWDRKAAYGRHFEITLAGGLRLTAQQGLAIDVRTRLSTRPKVEDPRHRYRLSMHATPKMLARVDSTDLPPPPKAPKLALATDGGTADGGGDGGSAKLAANGHDGGAVAGADAGRPPLVLAQATPGRRHRRPAAHHRARVTRHPRRRLHVARAAFAPSEAPAAKAAARNAPKAAADTAPAKAAAPSDAAADTAGTETDHPAPAPAPPTHTEAAAAVPTRHGRLLAIVLAAAGAVALLIAGLLFLRR